MSSSRARPYLDLKLSQSELSRRKKLPYGRFLRYRLNPTKYLKEMTSKWSIFEKPYLNSDSPRAMNLRTPIPDWPSDPSRPSGFFPPDPGLWIFRFAPGICWISGGSSPECGDTIELNLQMGLIPPGQYSGLDWTVVSSEEEVKVIEISERGFGVSASVHLEIAHEYEGPVTICAGGYLKGRAISELVVMNPFPGLTGHLRYEEAMALPAAFQVSTSYYEHYAYDCGCIELDVECDLCNDSAIAWDSDTSAETVARNDSCAVAITDSLGTGGPYDWSVSGTGFSLTYASTTGLGNQLNASGSACGTATITVTGCDGNSVTGYVRCTTGQWTLIDNRCAFPGEQGVDEGSNQWTKTLGKSKQIDTITTMNWNGAASCAEIDVAAACGDPAHCLLITGCGYGLTECGDPEDHCCRGATYPCVGGLCDSDHNIACDVCVWDDDCPGGWCNCVGGYSCLLNRDYYEWTC